MDRGHVNPAGLTKRSARVVGVLLTVAVFGVVLVPEAAGIEIGINGGISKTTGDRSRYMNMGFCGDVEALVPLFAHVMVGGRIACHRWGIEVFPQYHVVYTEEDESSEFWSVSVGAVIPLGN